MSPPCETKPESYIIIWTYRDFMIFMGLSYTDMSNLFPNLCLAFEAFTFFSAGHWSSGLWASPHRISLGNTGASPQHAMEDVQRPLWSNRQDLALPRRQWGIVRHSGIRIDMNRRMDKNHGVSWCKRKTCGIDWKILKVGARPARQCQIRSEQNSVPLQEATIERPSKEDTMKAVFRCREQHVSVCSCSLWHSNVVVCGCMWLFKFKVTKIVQPCSTSLNLLR